MARHGLRGARRRPVAARRERTRGARPPPAARPGRPPDRTGGRDRRQAIGVLGVLDEAGVRVPQDMALVSFDGIEPAGTPTRRSPPCSQHFLDLGVLAAQLALARVAGERVEPGAHRVPGRLMRRGSCGCDRGGPRAPGPRPRRWSRASRRCCWARRSPTAQALRNGRRSRWRPSSARLAAFRLGAQDAVESLLSLDRRRDAALRAADADPADSCPNAQGRGLGRARVPWTP